MCINTTCHFSLRLLPCPRCPTSPAAGTFPWPGTCVCNPHLQCSSSAFANPEHPFGDSQRQGAPGGDSDTAPVTPLDVLPTASVLLLLPPAGQGQIKQQQRSWIKYGIDSSGRNLLCTPGQERSLLSQVMGHPMFNCFKWQWGICFSCDQKQPLTSSTRDVGWRGGGSGVFHQKLFSLCKNPTNEEFQRLLWLRIPELLLYLQIPQKGQ